VPTAETFEDQVAAALAARGFRPGSRDDVDFENERGVVVEAKARIGGVRDLQAVILQLASRAHSTEVREAWLVLGDHRMPTSIVDSWKSVIEVLRPSIARKLRLIALSGKSVIVAPEKSELLAIGHDLARSALRDRPSRSYDAELDVIHVLLVRWLLRRPPIQMKELGAMTGLSQPTVRSALARVGRELTRDSSRRVALDAFPQRVWREMSALAPRIRETQYFVDASGRPRGPEKLLERLRQKPPPNVAIGGVFAARHWDPELDLEGAPRLDLCVHAVRHRPDLGFIQRLDPALRVTDAGAAGVSVAVHRVRRRQSLYESSPRLNPPWADPVETLLDLEELRLHAQADELIRRLRARSDG
jgi:hypothetical protein